MYQNLILQPKGRILFITINRESKLNALNKATLNELHQAFTSAIQNPETGGIVLTGAGTKAFVAGADISEFAAYGAEQGRQLSTEGQLKVFDIIHNCTKPVIAAINGFALGGGLELALACHIRIASENAKLGLPETSLGLIPGYGGTQRLTQLIGRGKAIEMILTADMVPANEGLGTGLVNHVVPQDELLLKAEEVLLKILSRSPIAVASAIKAVNASLGTQGYQTEINEFSACFGTPDFKEGVAAFLGKRNPDFGK